MLWRIRKLRFIVIELILYASAKSARLSVPLALRIVTLWLLSGCVTAWSGVAAYSETSIYCCGIHSLCFCVVCKIFGEISFSYAGPSVWNNLPQTLRHCDSVSSFRAALKTHLFNNYFCMQCSLQDVHASSSESFGYGC